MAGCRAGGVVLVVLLMAMLGPRRAEAQATRADSAAVILEAAGRFHAQGREDVATALYEYLLERFGDTVAAGEARRMLASAPGNRSTRSGRVELQVWSTLYGLWLGVAVPTAFGAEGPEPYGVGLLLGGPLGFLTGMGLARSRELTDGQARAITFGGSWGTWQGLGWAQVFDWGEVDYASCGPFGQCPEDKETERQFTAMILGGLAGIGTGALLSRKNIPSGVASTVNFGALWGTWFGVAGGVLADAENDALLTTTLLGGNAGLIATALLAPRWDMSVNRARLISIAGVIGGLGGAGIDLIVQPDDEKVGIGIPLAMSVAGLAIGAATTRNYDVRRRPAGSGLDGALLQYGNGRLSLGTLLPSPVLVPIERDGRRTRELAAGITLLHARF